MVVFAVTGALAAGCGSGSRRGSRSAPHPDTWVDQPVTFAAGGLTIYATFRHPVAQVREVPAVLLIAGSGPTDRNGNSPLIPGTGGTLKAVADWLSADGVASLRYDKLGSGQTGLGRYAARSESIGINPFEGEATAALSFLARQQQVDRNRLAVIGHSEGALFALLVATGTAGPAPRVHAIGLLEPLSLRYLDVIAKQIQAQVSAARRAGRITSSGAADVERVLTLAIKSLRTSGTVPPNLPAGLATVLNASTALFLSQADRHDPADLAARLAARLPVLVTCSDADIQVACTEVERVVVGLAKPPANTDFVRLRGVDHLLKEDPGRSATSYDTRLPFSRQLQTALRAFVGKNL
jgi:pimeloyl-ACP methyl ester carboxylesterase